MSWVPLYDSGLATAPIVRNGGASLLYPRWRVVGPGSYLRLENQTTSQVWILRYDLLAGLQLNIDFSPVKRALLEAPVGQEGGHMLITGPYPGEDDWWPLNLGDNRVYLELGRTSAASRITLIR